MACGAVLVLEPSADGGALKTGRKGTGDVRGASSTAAPRTPGSSPRRASTRSIEASHQVLAIAELGPPERGHDRDADGRVGRHRRQRRAGRGPHPRRRPGAVELGEAERVEVGDGRDSRRSTRTRRSRSRRRSTGRRCRSRRRPSCSPLAESPPTSAAAIVGVAVGGGSDGNFTAALGVPTLDGLGVGRRWRPRRPRARRASPRCPTAPASSPASSPTSTALSRQSGRLRP